MDVHGAGVAEIVEAPHLIQQLVAGVDPVGRGGQVVKQLHLLGGRIHLLAVHGQLKGVHVDDELVEHKPPRLLLRGHAGGAPQNRFNPGKHLLHFKGLGDIVVGAGFQAHDLGLGVALGGEHDDGGLCLGTDGLAHRPAVHHGHHHVQQHQVGLDGPEFGKTLPAVRRHGDGVALLLQIHLQQLRNIAVVLYDQNGNSHDYLPPNLISL